MVNKTNIYENLQKGEILVITNRGDFIVNQKDYIKFNEEMEVTLGEQNKNFTVYINILSTGIRIKKEDLIDLIKVSS